MRRGLGRGGAVGVVCFLLLLVAAVRQTAMAEPPAPAQDPAQNPAIAAMPAGASGSGEFVGAASADGSSVVSQLRYDDGRTVDVGIRSVAMGGITLPVRVVLPPGFTPGGGARYPVALFLHGGNDNYTAWTRETDVAARTAQAGMLGVFPEGGRAAHYTDYLVKTSPSGPLQWETFHLTEMMEILAQAFGADTGRMGVTGISAGGYGAAAYPSRHPGMFRFMAVMSGPLDIQDPTVQALVLNTPADGTQPNDRFGDPAADAANWQAHNPAALVDQVRGTSIFISSGLTGQNSPADDAAGNPWSPVQFVEVPTGQVSQRYADLLKSKGIPVTTDFYQLGQHNWPAWRQELPKAFAQLETALGAAGQPGAAPAPGQVPDPGAAPAPAAGDGQAPAAGGGQVPAAGGGQAPGAGGGPAGLRERIRERIQQRVQERVQQRIQQQG